MTLNRNTILGAAVVVVLLLYQRRRSQQQLQRVAQQQQEQQESQRRQTGNEPDRVDIDFLLNEQREELTEDGASHISEDKSPAQVIRDNQDELPDDEDWEKRVELDPKTNEPYNVAQYAWLVTNDKV